ncbi:MAG: antitoxin [Streptosporangiales bacterium]
MSIMDKLKGLVGKNPDKAKEGLDKATSFVDEKTGGKYSEKIDRASDKAHNVIDDSQAGHGGQGAEEGEHGSPHEQGGNSQQPDSDGEERPR